jgi:predicted outer membrane protein
MRNTRMSSDVGTANLCNLERETDAPSCARERQEINMGFSTTAVDNAAVQRSMHNVLSSLSELETRLLLSALSARGFDEAAIRDAIERYQDRNAIIAAMRALSAALARNWETR